jgi:hypothetical protein
MTPRVLHIHFVPPNAMAGAKDAPLGIAIPAIQPFTLTGKIAGIRACLRCF